MIAAFYGHVRVVDYLLKEGADADIRDNNGWTTLMHAARNGHSKVRQFRLVSIFSSDFIC